jgi:VWFA-related protein
VRPLATLVLAGLFGCSVAFGAGPAVGFSDRVEVRRVSLPVWLVPRENGGCDALDPAWVEVLEDGRASPALHLERRRLDTVHAILLDTSESMVSRLSQATDAVERYLAALPEEESVFLGTFDDFLVLRVARTMDRDRIRADLDRVRVHWNTAMWASIRQMVEFLRTSPERSVLVVVTDGCDTLNTSPLAVREIVDRASRTENLTVFTIGIDLPRFCPGAPDLNRPGVVLESLARTTGGKFFTLRDAKQLDRVLPKIRARLDAEGHVTYEPVPFGEGPRDRADRESSRWRKIKLQVDSGAPCDVRLAGTTQRYEGTDRAFLGGGPAEEEREWADPIALDTDGRAIAGTVTDVIQDSGPLYVADAYEQRGRFRVRIVESASTAEREVRAPVPPATRTIGGAGRPEDAVLHALRATDASGRWTDAPFLVNGTTLLAQRGALARALFADPEYGAWAYEKIRSRRLEQIEALYPESAADDGASDSDAPARLRAALEGQAWATDDREIQEYLAAWLADVPALELAVAVEGRLAAEALGTAGRPEVALAEAEKVWRRLRGWLDASIDVHTLGLLVPGYGPELGVVGFYRIVLPMDNELGPPEGLVPAVPYGIHTLAWLAKHEDLPDDILDGLGLRSIRYDRARRRDLRDIRRSAAAHGRGVRDAPPELWRVVTLEFDERAGDGPILRGYFTAENPVAEEAVRFDAVVVSSPGGTEGGADPLVEAMRELQGSLDGPAVVVD